MKKLRTFGKCEAVELCSASKFSEKTAGHHTESPASRKTVVHPEKQTGN